MGAAAKLSHTPDVRPPLPAFAIESGLLGDALLKLRMAKRLALSDVAAASGIRWRIVSRFERGARPSFEQLEALARALDVDAEALADLRAGRSLARTRPQARVELHAIDAAPGAPGSTTWDELPWADDPHAQAAVKAGEEMSTEAIAERTGWSHRTVQRALEGALAKLADR